MSRLIWQALEGHDQRLLNVALSNGNILQGTVITSNHETAIMLVSGVRTVVAVQHIVYAQVVK